MVRNQTVLEGLVYILARRGTVLEAWEAKTGWEAGSIIKALQPPDGPSLNRNVKLIAHKLETDAEAFLEKIERIESEKSAEL